MSLPGSVLEALGSLEIRISFSMDLVIIVPLYFALDICSDPAVRRQALSLLSRLSLPRQEGTWNANNASRVGQWVINVEEEGLGVVESTENVISSSRIQRIDAIAYMEEHLDHLRFFSKKSSYLVNLMLKETPKISKNFRLHLAKISRSFMHRLHKKPSVQ